MKQRIVLAGGSGFLGGVLAKYFTGLEWEVVVLTRSPRPRSDGVREVGWDARTLGKWIHEIDGATALVNLTGRSVNCRYTAKNRCEIMESRVDSTRVLGEAIAQCAKPPGVWLNSSTATIYQHTFGQAHEDSSCEMKATPEAKDAFSVDVAQAWERALSEAATPRTRKVALRLSMVLGLGHNSVFPVLRRLTRLGLGGKQGSGKQFVSWIHEEDFCRAIEWIILHEGLAGAVNVCGPNPLPNAEMMKSFREICEASIGLPATEWMLEIGAFFLRTETELIFKSRRVVPRRLLESGFAYRFSYFHDAIQDLLRKETVS